MKVITWDTYVAVDLRDSVQGNNAFIDALNEHRRKYRDTCPRDKIQQSVFSDPRTE